MKKVDWVIKFNKNASLKNTYWHEHSKKNEKAKNDFEKYFLSWLITQFLEKLLKMSENIDIKLVGFEATC